MVDKQNRFYRTAFNIMFDRKSIGYARDCLVPLISRQGGTVFTKQRN